MEVTENVDANDGPDQQSLQIDPIGVVRTARADPRHTPVQAAANLDEEGVAIVDERYRAGLDGLEGFSHVWLLTWFGPRGADDVDGAPVELHQRPFLRPDGPPIGIFAMRGPARPVPIGLSLVEVVEVADGAVRFRGVDILDGTPLLDLKPYFADADQPRSEIRSGWFDELTIPAEATPATLDQQPPGP